MNSRQRVLAASERQRPDRPATSMRFTPEPLQPMRMQLGCRPGNVFPPGQHPPTL